MAKNRKNQAAIRFGPALKALLLCLLIAGSAVGYVWQKSQIYQLGKQMRELESRRDKLARNNQLLDSQLESLRSPLKLDPRGRSLGLVPQQPGQVVRLPEMPSAMPDDQTASRQFAGRPTGGTPQ
jgi:cell division protein FtsB